MIRTGIETMALGKTIVLAGKQGDPLYRRRRFEQALIRGKELLDSVDYQWTK